MTHDTHDGYERMLDDFAVQLRTGVARSTRRKRGRRGATAVSMLAACVGAVALLLSGAGGGAHVDVLAQARAALAMPGQIVHLITTEHVEIRGGAHPESGPSSTREQWSSTSPARWRVALTIPTPDATPEGKPLGNTDGLVTGPMQFSYGGGSSEEYFEQSNSLNITTGVSEQSPQASPTGPLGVEPIAQVRTMLGDGQLGEAGTTTVNGKAALRLLGAYPRGENPPWHVEYDVDPTTYAPVQVTIEVAQPSRPASKGIQTIVVSVGRYELVPLNASTESLLSISPTGTPTVHRYGS
jgi:hypothetical protein